MSDTEIDKLSLRLSASVASAADKVAMAIPGERYARLIEDAHGTDPQKRAAAQAFVKSLFGVSLDEEFVALAYFRDIPDGVTFDMFWVPSGTPEEIGQYIKDLNLNLRAPVSYTPPKLVLPSAALSWSISQDPVLVLLVKAADVDRAPDMKVHVGMFKRSFIDTEIAKYSGTGQPAVPPLVLPSGPPILWQVDPPPINLGVGLRGLDFYTFRKQDFLQGQVVTHSIQGELRYAVHNMIRTPLITDDVVRKYVELREAEQKWRQAHDARK